MARSVFVGVFDRQGRNSTAPKRPASAGPGRFAFSPRVTLRKIGVWTSGRFWGDADRSAAWRSAETSPILAARDEGRNRNGEVCCHTAAPLVDYGS